MAWISVIDENEADDDLAKLYRQLIEPWGGVDNIMKIHSLHHASLDAHLQIYKTLMHGKGPLSRIQREMIAVVASSANGCHY